MQRRNGGLFPESVGRQIVHRVPSPLELRELLLEMILRESTSGCSAQLAREQLRLAGELLAGNLGFGRRLVFLPHVFLAPARSQDSGSSIFGMIRDIGEQVWTEKSRRCIPVMFGAGIAGWRSG